MRQKILEILQVVEKIENESSRVAKQSKFAADEASGGLTASYSAAGDAEHARNTANLSIQKHQSIKRLTEELENSLQQGLPEKTETGCYIKTEMSGSVKELFLVENPVYVEGYNLISPSSPIGKAILGKKVEDLFLYENGDKTFTGKILEIG